MSRRAILPAAILGAALLLTLVAVLRTTSWGPDPSASVEPVEQAPQAIPESSETEEEAGPEPLRRHNVLIYFPAADGDGLLGEPHEIFMTAAPGDRAKQIVADLISGPANERALRALPPGTQLRQVFVLDNGTAWADFSADLRQGIRGGSTEELLTVYSIVNSVSLNVSEIRRLGILINGRPIETLNGHMDLRRPLPPDPSLILETVESTIVRAAGSADPIFR